MAKKNLLLDEIEENEESQQSDGEKSDEQIIKKLSNSVNSEQESDDDLDF